MYGREDLAALIDPESAGSDRAALDAARLHKLGVIMAFGTDLIYLDSVHDAIDIELRLLNQAGLSPAEILTLATVNAARYAERPDLGTISEGARADIVISGADPLATTDFTNRIDLVMKDGRIIYDFEGALA
ncbi:hypothetical protein A5743_25475 [Mycolicibacterium conceptionense]|nr:hypothetical protein A5743_25475 [Mycolicibacterium conceptionense]